MVLVEVLVLLFVAAVLATVGFGVVRVFGGFQGGH